MDENEIINGMRDYANKHHINGGFVLGLSGGVDSALVYAMAVKTGLPVHTYFINIKSLDNDCADANQIYNSQQPHAENRTFEIVDLTSNYYAMLSSLGITEDDSITCQNIKSRLRMVYLRAQCNRYNALLLGTGNLCEWKTGYFTRGGDGDCDIAPLINLYKSEVREMSQRLGIPENIVNKVPSAGLFEGQCDESDLGVSYIEIENHLKGVKNKKVAKLIRKSAFKRKKPVTF